MPRVHHVKKARKDNTVCKVGEPYYWWKFRYGGRRESLVYPKQSQLTQSAFLGGMYDIGDTIGALTTDEVQDGWLDDLISDIEEQRDQCEESKSNMPESLQESPTGEMLQERYDACDSMIEELQGIDADIDEDALREEAQAEVAGNNGEGKADADDDDVKDKFNDLLEDKKQEILDEVQGISYEGP